MRRAIVLLGGLKHGSSSLDEVLTRLRPSLAEVGLCYPKLTCPGARADLPIPLDSSRIRLAKALEETGADTVIVSGEDLAGIRPEALASLFATFGFAMEAAFVVRPQAEQLAAAYALRTQHIAEARSFRAFVQREGFSDRYDFAAQLGPWRSATDGVVRVLPARDRRSSLPLTERLVRDLGLARRLDPLLVPGDLLDRTPRPSGPIAIEASRRLHRLGLHRQVSGHPRRVGHFLDHLAWVRGLDAEPFRGDGRQALAAVEAYHGETNERVAAAAWGCSWESVVARSPVGTPNELASHPGSPETEAAVGRLVEDVAVHFGYRPPPAWLCRIDAMVEDGIERVADLIGRPGYRAR